MDYTTCIYDENEELPLPEFHKKYKDHFPMTAIVTGGYYGNTKWDDLPSDLIMRIDREFRQPRILARDPKSYKEQYISIPVNGPYKFNIVKSIKEKSQDQTMAEILEQNPLPILVQFSPRGEVPKEGQMSPTGTLISFLIEYRQEDIYLQGNFYNHGVIATETASVILCPIITMAPVHGLKDKTEEEYNLYLQRMSDYVYKKSKFSENTCNLGVKVYEASDPEISHIIPKKPDRDTGPAPALPQRKDIKVQSAKPKLDKTQNIKQSQRPPNRQITQNHKEPMKAKESENFKVSETLSESNQKSTITMEVPGFTETPVGGDSDDEIYGEDYEEITQEKKPGSSKPEVSNKPGYVNDVLCQVRPFSEPRAEDSDNESNEYEEIKEKLPIPQMKEKVRVPKNIDNREPMKLIETPRVQRVYDYAIPDPNYFISKQEAHKDMSVGIAPAEENIQTPCMSNHVSGKSIKELGEILVKLKLDKFVDRFSEDMIDGEIVQDLTVADLKEDYNFTKTEAIRLRKFIEQGHIPM
ncbi:uncharacterized protein LOC133187339 [Saccostrea echinata]|uniref:uncharacterized protein LOC133187339 n=1 Tax=Saccostrea echinata TaxID=191078 RepID=UPI002A81EBFE|nr:uncharacterized protein LOC133187339 [Saccostrea echinata]